MNQSKKEIYIKEYKYTCKNIYINIHVKTLISSSCESEMRMAKVALKLSSTPSACARNQGTCHPVQLVGTNWPFDTIRDGKSVFVNVRDSW